MSFLSTIALYIKNFDNNKMITNDAQLSMTYIKKKSKENRL